MILTITLNPLLERRFKYNNVKINEENRGGIEEIKTGGKGINVSRQLNLFNVRNLAFTFLGGSNGKILKEILSKENINFTSVRTRSETRNAALVINKSENTISTYFGQNSEITKNESEEFKSKLEKMIQNCELVVFAGSSPCEVTNSIIPFGINVANKYDKISLCDTYGTHLKDCIDAGPTILHNNIRETENSLEIKLQTEEEKLEHLYNLYSKNIKQAYLTNGKNPVYCSNFDYHFKVNIPQIESADATGSGDSFVAGIIYGWHNNLTFEESLKFAVASGTANSGTFSTSDVTISEIEKLKEKITVEPIGKKMKTLDVTPR